MSMQRPPLDGIETLSIFLTLGFYGKRDICFKEFIGVVGMLCFHFLNILYKKFWCQKRNPVMSSADLRQSLLHSLTDSLICRPTGNIVTGIAATCPFFPTRTTISSSRSEVPYHHLLISRRDFRWMSIDWSWGHVSRARQTIEPRVSWGRSS